MCVCVCACVCVHMCVEQKEGREEKVSTVMLLL